MCDNVNAAARLTAPHPIEPIFVNFFECIETPMLAFMAPGLRQLQYDNSPILLIQNKSLNIPDSNFINFLLRFTFETICFFQNTLQLSMAPY